MPNPAAYINVDDSSSDGSKRVRRIRSKQTMNSQTFSETLNALQECFKNLAEVTQRLQEQHEREVENLTWQNVQMRKELKVAGAFTKAASMTISHSMSLRTVTEASADDQGRFRGWSPEIGLDMTRLSTGPEMTGLSSAPEMTATGTGPQSKYLDPRLVEAQQRRSSLGRAVREGQQLDGATSSKKRAKRQLTAESLLSTVDSTGTPSLGDSYMAASMSSGTPSCTQFAAYQPPLPPSAEPPYGVQRVRAQEEQPLQYGSPAETASLADTVLDPDDQSSGSGSAREESQTKVVAVAPTSEGSLASDVLHIFKLHHTWDIITREMQSSRSYLQSLSGTRASRKKRSSSILTRSSAVEDLCTVTQQDRWERCIRICTLHPESSIRIVWELTGMLFLAYDFVTVPLQIFGEVFEDSDRSFALSTAGTTFWTLDIIVSLRSGILYKERVVMSPWLIFLNYAKTWMLLDLCLVGLDWVVIATGSSKSAAGSARMLKFLRVFRLLRLRKVMDFISKVEAMSNSNLVVLILSVFKHVVILVMLNHLIACLWYAVGESSEGWTLSGPGTLQRTMAYRYLTSLHWSVTQFHGSMDVYATNVDERLLSVTVLIFSMVGNAAFISAVTNKMMQAQNLVQVKTRIEQSFRSFLRENHVSLGLSVRLKKAISNVQMDKQSKEAKAQLLALIPPSLKIQLHMETRGPSIFGHAFLRQMASVHSRSMSVIIDQAVQDLQFSVNSEVFHVGEVGKSMYFIVGGNLSYKFLSGKPSKISDAPWKSYSVEDNADTTTLEMTKGDRISEAPLWVQWVHVGRLASVTEVSVLELNATDFMNLVQTSKPLHSDVATYARGFLSWIEFMAHNDELITDSVTVPKERLMKSGSDSSGESL